MAIFQEVIHADPPRSASRGVVDAALHLAVLPAVPDQSGTDTCSRGLVRRDEEGTDASVLSVVLQQQ